MCILVLSVRYDVELFQRIEQLIGKKMPQFQTEEEEVMQLQERVAEAQRIAAQVGCCCPGTSTMTYTKVLLS